MASDITDTLGMTGLFNVYLLYCSIVPVMFAGEYPANWSLEHWVPDYKILVHSSVIGEKSREYKILVLSDYRILVLSDYKILDRITKYRPSGEQNTGPWSMEYRSY